MVRVAHGAHLDDERRVAEAPERGGGEERALEAVRLPGLEDAARGARGLAALLLVVPEIVEESLNRAGRAQSGRKAETPALFHDSRGF